jgi:hypothetical protein
MDATRRIGMNYGELRKIDVGAHIEKKNGLSYLSWSWAVDTLLQHDPMATWEFPEPTHFGESVMVHCNVMAFGKTMRMHLPVMDFKNQALKNPTSVDVNKAMMRCLAKCIACFGIGLYIYSGEDLPEDAVKDNPLDKFNGTYPEAAERAVGKPKPKPGAFQLHIPGKESVGYTSLPEWLNGYQEMCARVMASKLEPAIKNDKLDALRHTNAATISKLEVNDKVMLTASQAKNKAELGLSQ